MCSRRVYRGHLLNSFFVSLRHSASVTMCTDLMCFWEYLWQFRSLCLEVKTKKVVLPSGEKLNSYVVPEGAMLHLVEESHEAMQMASFLNSLLLGGVQTCAGKKLSAESCMTGLWFYPLSIWVSGLLKTSLWQPHTESRKKKLQKAEKP